MNLEKFEIKLHKTRHVRKFNSELRDYTVKFNQMPSDFISSLEYLTEIMTNLLAKIKDQINKNDKIQIFINHVELSYPISTPFMLVDDLTPDLLLKSITKVIQSNKKLALDEKITFHANILKSPNGSGGKRLTEFIAKKRCIISVKEENDSLCCLRAIVIAQAFADGNLIEFNKLKRRDNNIQSRQAILMADKYGLDYNKPIGLKEIKLIEKDMAFYQFVLIDGSSLHKIVYMGDFKDKKIVLYLDNNHYFVVTSIPAFFGVKYFCFTCKLLYSSQFENHKCNDVCKKCKWKTGQAEPR